MTSRGCWRSAGSRPVARRSLLGHQVWTVDRSQPALSKNNTDRPLASGRDGRPDPWSPHVLGCAVDDGGAVLDILVQKRRNKAAALKLRGVCLRTRESIPRRSPRTSWRHTAQPPGSWVSRIVTDLAGCARITAPKTRTSTSEDESESSRSSSPRLSPTVPLQPRRDLQHLQPPISSDLTTRTSNPESTGP